MRRFGGLGGGAVASLLIYTGAQAAAPSFELCPGFMIVTAVSTGKADYESIKKVVAADDDGVRIRYSNQFLYSDIFAPGAPDEVRSVVTFRTMRRADLQSATLYLQHFSEILPDIVPETTAIGISRDLYAQLKKTGSAEMGIFIRFSTDTVSIDREVHPSVYDAQMITTVTREAESPPFKVVINDTMTELPTMTFGGDFMGEMSQFTVIDDPQMPLMLRFRIGMNVNAIAADEEREKRKAEGRSAEDVSGDREALEVVKIVTPCPPPVEIASAAPDRPPSLPPPLPLPGDFSSAGGDFDSKGKDMTGSGDLPPPPPPDAPAPPPPAPPEMKPGDLTTGYPAPPALPAPAPLPVTPEPAAAPPSVQSAAIEKEIEADGAADIQAIFFATDSAEIRAESEPALAAIADVLKRHPDWHMSIEGHTDSQADDAYNLDLSKQRAAAVKVALVTLYDIADARLTTDGHGESKPIGDNKTLAGRAQNRRVELVKR